MENDARLSNYAEAGLEEYHELSRLAIVSAVLGPLSIAALTHPAFSVVGFAAVASGLVALAFIANRDGSLQGRNLAVFGLVLGVFFSGWSISEALSWRQAMFGQAREYAEAWYDTIDKGDYFAAHQGVLPTYKRLNRAVYLPRAYKIDSGLKKEYDNFMSEKIVEMLVDDQRKLEPRFVKNLKQSYQKQDLYVFLQYDLVDVESKDVAVETEMTLKRVVSPADRSVSWEVVQVMDKQDL